MNVNYRTGIVHCKFSYIDPPHPLISAPPFLGFFLISVNMSSKLQFRLYYLFSSTAKTEEIIIDNGFIWTSVNPENKSHFHIHCKVLTYFRGGHLQHPTLSLTPAIKYIVYQLWYSCSFWRPNRELSVLQKV